MINSFTVPVDDFGGSFFSGSLLSCSCVEATVTTELFRETVGITVEAVDDFEPSVITVLLDDGRVIRLDCFVAAATAAGDCTTGSELFNKITRKQMKTAKYTFGVS